MLWTLPFLSRLGAYIAFEMSVQVLLPLLLTVLILSSTLVAILLHPAVGLRYVAVTAMMGLLRCSYAIYRTRDPRFLMFLLYGFIHVFLLIPVRIRALLTLTDNRWGTAPRSARARRTTSWPTASRTPSLGRGPAPDQ